MATGLFVVSIIENYNWEQPIFRKECKDLKELEIILKEFVIKVRHMIEKENKS